MADQTQSPEYQMEVLRRRAAQGASSAGLPGGAPAANQISPENPLANSMTVPNQTVATQGAGGFPSGAGIAKVETQKTGEAETIVKALVDRLRKLGETPQV